MKTKTIRALKVYPRHYPIPTDIDNTLEALQEFVGGYIETVTITEKLVLICNEEGKIKNLPKNRELFWTIGEDKERRVIRRDCLVGDALICAYDNEGNFRSLTAREQWYLFQHFQPEEVDMSAEGLKYLSEV